MNAAAWAAFLDHTPVHAFIADPLTAYLSANFNLSLHTIYLVAQTLLFVLLVCVSYFLHYKKVPRLTAIFLSLIGIYELTYIGCAMIMKIFAFDIIPSAIIGVTGLTFFTMLHIRKSEVSPSAF